MPERMNLYPIKINVNQFIVPSPIKIHIKVQGNKHKYVIYGP